MAISLTGASTAHTWTSASGAYAFTSLCDGTYTVTPSLSGYTFSPSERQVTVSGADVTDVDFTASAKGQPSTYSVSGIVSGAVAAGVSLALGGAATRSTQTDGAGSYTFGGQSSGSYRVWFSS